jgi:CheY-like chemotaxis protein
MSEHRHTALLVDDHRDGREAVEVLIQTSGFDVVGARTGAEGLALLRGGLGCCLVVLDWWLPDMTGGAFVEQLQADPALADIAVAMCTADQSVSDRGERPGVKCVLLKPVDPTHLVSLVGDYCPKADARRVA